MGLGTRQRGRAAAIMAWRGPELAMGKREKREGEGEGRRWVLWDGEGLVRRAGGEGGGEGKGEPATIMGWRGLPPPEGGRWVAREYYGMGSPSAAGWVWVWGGEVLWDGGAP